MKPDTEKISYQNPIIDKDETAVPLGTTILPPPTTTTTDHRSKWTMTTVRSLDIIVAIVVGMMLVAVAVLMQDNGSSYNHSSGNLNANDDSIATAAESLVAATWPPGKPCLPATEFGYYHHDESGGKDTPFETCYQLGDDPVYCWSNSYEGVYGYYFQCFPIPSTRLLCSR